MPELILILFKINLVLLLFAAVYYVVLRRLTFYTVNRLFLAIGIIFSSIYPFINLTDFFYSQEQINPRIVSMMPSIDVNQLVRSTAIIEYWQIVMIVFYLGVAFMAIRLFAQFVSLFRVHQRSRPGAVRNLNVRILEDRVSPFSFWQTVYINPTIHSSSELDTILAHEQVHVKEWHTLDIILAEVSVVFYWFNPGVWLMKRAIKENIEFITDARIVNKGVDKKAYQYSLLGVGNFQASVGLVNNFNLSDLKKRIKMMNAKRSSPKKLVIYAFVLPVLLATTLAFTIEKKEITKHLMPFTMAIKKAELFTNPTPKKEIITARAKVKRTANLAKRDTTFTFQIVRAIRLVSDSIDILPELPEAIKIARDEHLGSALKGRIRGKVTDATFFYTTNDSTRVKGTVTRMESIKITLRNPGQPLPTSTDANFKEVIVTGYATKKKATAGSDSVRTVIGNPSIQFNGRSITEEELGKIKAENIKSVVVKRDPNTKTGVIVIAKNP